MDALILLLPMLLIWALFEQMASQWTLQSTAMQNTQSGSSFTFEDSDQTQMVINLLLIILTIPFLQYALYLLISKPKLPTHSLHKMTIRGLLAAYAFLIFAFVQLKIKQGQPNVLVFHPYQQVFVLVHGFDDGVNCFQSPMNLQGIVSQETLALKIAPPEKLANFSALLADTCHSDKVQSVKATFSNLPEGSATFLFFVESPGLAQTYEKQTFVGSSSSSMAVLYGEKMISKHQEGLDGTTLLFTLFNLHNYENGDQKMEGVFTFSGYFLRESTADRLLRTTIRSPEVEQLEDIQERSVKLEPYLETLKVEINGNGEDILMGVSLKGLEQNANDVTMTNKDLKKNVRLKQVLKIGVAKQQSIFVQFPQYMVITVGKIIFDFGNQLVDVFADLQIYLKPFKELLILVFLMLLGIAHFVVMI